MNLDGFAAFPQRLSDDLPSKGTVDEKTKRSGSFEPELAADGLFDLFARAAIILRQLVYRFSGFVPLGYNRRGNSCPD